jgi:hypothetical protein
VSASKLTGPRASIPVSSAGQNDESGDETTKNPDNELSELVANGAQELDITNITSTYSRPPQGEGFIYLALKPDHQNLPLWIDGSGKITLENSHWETPRVQGLLMAVAEPNSQPTFMREYNLTFHSVRAAHSTGLNTKDIVTTLARFSKNGLPIHVADFITKCGKIYGIEDTILESNRCVNHDNERRDYSVPKIRKKRVTIDTSRLGKFTRAIITSNGKAKGKRGPGKSKAAAIRASRRVGGCK